jgi:CheY-like chemotaxis protein
MFFSQMGNVGNRTLCVAEDEILLRLDAVLLLEEAGLEVQEFVCAEQALAYLEIKASTVVFLFTDVRTPGRIDGVALHAFSVHAQRRNTWEFPIVRTESALRHAVPKPFDRPRSGDRLAFALQSPEAARDALISQPVGLRGKTSCR